MMQLLHGGPNSRRVTRIGPQNVRCALVVSLFAHLPLEFNLGITVVAVLVAVWCDEPRVRYTLYMANSLMLGWW